MHAYWVGTQNEYAWIGWTETLSIKFERLEILISSIIMLKQAPILGVLYVYSSEAGYRMIEELSPTTFAWARYC